MEVNTSDKSPWSFIKRHRRKIILWGLVIFVLGFGLVVLISYKTFQYFYSKAGDPLVVYTIDKNIEASVPEWINVEVNAEEAIPARLSKVLELEIPIREDVEVLIDDDFSVPVNAALSVPLDQDIYVETEIPVDIQIPLEGIQVETRILGVKRSLPLSGTFPVKTVVPVRRPLHIKTTANVQLQETVMVHVKKKLTLPLDLNLQVKIPIEGVFDVHFADMFNLNARMPEKIPVDVHVEMAISKDGLLKIDSLEGLR